MPQTWRMLDKMRAWTKVKSRNTKINMIFTVLFLVSVFVVAWSRVDFDPENPLPPNSSIEQRGLQATPVELYPAPSFPDTTPLLSYTPPPGSTVETSGGAQATTSEGSSRPPLTDDKSVARPLERVIDTVSDTLVVIAAVDLPVVESSASLCATVLITICLE